MNTIFKKFYRFFYWKTGGYIPSMPLNQKIYPGDFFQIRNGEMVVLGNIFKGSLVNADDADLTYNLKLNAMNWVFSDGVTKPYSGRGNEHNIIDGDFEFAKQILAFDKAGSFLFKGEHPESVKLSNWSFIEQELIIKLTQTYYSFREVYVVTESTTTSNWALAIAEREKAELELAVQNNNYELLDLFGHQDTKTISSRDIAYHHRENKRIPSFFRAKKLVVQVDKIQNFINNMTQEYGNKDDWAHSFFEARYESSGVMPSIGFPNVGTSILDMLPANALNPNTALNYFKWDDANMDDIEKLFLGYSED
ncbi:hypothetical protein [uncultured Psychroserpens sp.]|uniref:hypothetical protein n=1 Tax=uncultured Psychroserpens sp. TaxID=255436 RepID=UPI002607DF9E|nr:hypothetical protein [uncultured Psychroserpens sp.]